MSTPPSFGILHDFRQPLPHTQGYAAFYADCLAEVKEAERLGYDAVWLSEHHVTADGFLPSPLAMAAAIAVGTHTIAIGTSILVLPLHHPLRVAEDAVVADLLSDGRFRLGLGQGYVGPEFAALGVDRRTRAARLAEGATIIRQLWDTGQTRFAGSEWELPEGTFSPRPERRIPILFGAVSDPAVERAVRVADGLLVYCGKPADLLPRQSQLTRALAVQGRARDTFRFVATGIVHVDEDPDRAWAHAAPGIAYLEGQLAAHGPNATSASDGLHRAEYLVGDPDDIAARFTRLHTDVPFDHFAFWARLPSLSHEQALTSLRLFAEEVVPRIHHARDATP
jgi:alkanesulfonate monooxygenase SsuD/methylene tetrahydromethanopterin reductase-like flavin-dependent oxidoreductase (luciferase family)